MLSKQRKDYLDQKSRRLVEGVLEELERASALEKSGNYEEADQMVSNLKSRLEGEINEGKDDTGHRKYERRQFPDAGSYLITSDRLKLKAFDGSCREMYLKTSEENAELKSAFKDPSFKDMMWEDCMDETALYYAIEEKASGKYAGYVAIKDTDRTPWELAIELLQEFRHKGIGKEAIFLLLKGLNERTGEKIFRVRVDSDNYACQALMRKIGARTNGISELLLHGSMLEQFQKDNVNLIDDQMRRVADEFCVDAEDLLGHVLEYLIEWDALSKKTTAL